MPLTDLVQSEDSLTIGKCAYWMSLLGAPETTNRTNKTVYLPRNNVMSAEALKEIARRNSQEEFLHYAP